MKKILYMATSVDGYIAAPDDETPWSDTGWKRYIKAVDGAGCLIIGRRTYEIMLEDGFDQFGSLKLLIVVSSSKLENDQLPLKSSSSPGEALTMAEKESFQAVVIAGGAELNTAFINLDLVDEIQLDVEPIILGEGIPFVCKAKRVKLERANIENLDEGVTHIEYKVVK